MEAQLLVAGGDLFVSAGGTMKREDVSPVVPVYTVFGGRLGTVDEQLAIIPLQVPHTAFVSSSGLKPKSDNVHFDAPSLREFGRRYAHAFLMLDPGWSKE